MPYVLTDTGFLYAVFDRDDEHHREAMPRYQHMEEYGYRIILLWPILYETLRTRFVRNRHMLDTFDKFLRHRNVIPVDVAHHYESAYYLALESSLRGRRPISMVDCLIRIALEDRAIPVNYLATFNDSDFYDARNARNIRLLVDPVR